jgi:phospholipid transport system substrate-binding protein
MKSVRLIIMLFFVVAPLVVLAGLHPAEKLVRDTTDKMLKALEREKPVLDKHPERIYDLVKEIVLPHFDFPSMARSVLGKYWRRASAKQRQRFVDGFRQLIVRTYAKSLNEYTGQKVNYLPMRKSVDANEVTVRAEIEQKSGFPIPIEYDLRLEGKRWLVIGLSIDGVNLVINYRTSFSTEIRQSGLEATIQKLEKRNREART